MAEEGYEILDYVEGMNAIDWTLIAERDYENRECKVACMAECLSPTSVSAVRFFAVYVKTREAEKAVLELAGKHKLSCHINLADNMFASETDV